MHILRPLLFLLCWLSALAPRAEAAGNAPSSSDLPRLLCELNHGFGPFGCGVTGRFLVRQNPWSAFDPDGLAENEISYAPPPRSGEDCFRCHPAQSGGGVSIEIPNPFPVICTIVGAFGKALGGLAAGNNPAVQYEYQKMIAPDASEAEIVNRSSAQMALNDAAFAVSGAKNAPRIAPDVPLRTPLPGTIRPTYADLYATMPPPSVAYNAPTSTPSKLSLLTGGKGSLNPATKAAALSGTALHSDKPGNLPDQLRSMYPETVFKFTPPGKAGQDAQVIGGMHPSAYPYGNWPKGVNYGDFKPNTDGGRRTFQSDQQKKWTEPTHMLPYDPQTGTLQE